MSTNINVFDDSGWTEGSGAQSGMTQKVLHDENGVTAFLVSCPAGMTIPAQSHPYLEENIILQGHFVHEGKDIPAGTFQRFQPGEVHGPYECPEKVIGMIIYHDR